MTALFKALTEAPGASGFEGAVRDVMRRYLEPHGEILTDNLGSIICRKGSSGPKIMLAAHLDEIGFMVTRITDEGFLKFQPLGGWWDQVLAAQRVQVGTKSGPVVGVIGSKPPHVMTPDDRGKLYEKKDMFIDVGALSREEALSFGIRPGDPVVPFSPFTVMHNPKLLMAKAWDNRFGCALAIEVLRQFGPHPNILYAVGNAQEEVGLRGAITATNIIKPDIGFVLETSVAGDTPGVDAATAKLGHGPVILLYDGSMIPHTGLRDLVIDTAAACSVPLQLDSLATYGTDGARIQVSGAGVPTLVVGVPVRYIHTHASIMHRDDFDNAVKLMVAVLQRLDAKTVQELTR